MSETTVEYSSNGQAQPATVTIEETAKEAWRELRAQQRRTIEENERKEQQREEEARLAYVSKLRQELSELLLRNIDVPMDTPRFGLVEIEGHRFGFGWNASAPVYYYRPCMRCQAWTGRDVSNLATLYVAMMRKDWEPDGSNTLFDAAARQWHHCPRGTVEEAAESEADPRHFSERAIEAYNGLITQREEAAAEHAERTREGKARQLGRSLGRLGIQAEPTDGRIELDGYIFEWDDERRYGGELWLMLPCSTCERGENAYPIPDLETLGRIIARKDYDGADFKPRCEGCGKAEREAGRAVSNERAPAEKSPSQALADALYALLAERGLVAADA